MRNNFIYEIHQLLPDNIIYVRSKHNSYTAATRAFNKLVKDKDESSFRFVQVETILERK